MSLSKEIEANNEMIKAFMKEAYPESFYGPMPERMQYHCKWSQLMPVVNELRHHYDISIQLMDGDCNFFCNKQTLDNDEVFSIGGYRKMIEGIYDGVVRTIKYHNKNKIHVSI